MSRCLTWAVVDGDRVECSGKQGHGGMHSYDRPCPHLSVLVDRRADSVGCRDCGKVWS